MTVAHSRKEPITTRAGDDRRATRDAKRDIRIADRQNPPPKTPRTDKPERT